MALVIPGGVTVPPATQAGIDPVTGAATGSTGANDPQTAMYAGYKNPTDPRQSFASMGATMTTDARVGNQGLHVYDPWGPGVRPAGGRTYRGAWVNPNDPAYRQGGALDPTSAGTYASTTTDPYTGQPLFKYNQMLMTVAENFDPFMQKQEAVCPHWWINRIPRRAYKLFDGLVHQTNLYRGGLSVYSGLGDWDDLQNDPTKADACAPMPFKTYQYAWETRAWSGKKTAWGSDPICLDIFKFTPHAMEQLGWILETGVKFGTDIQNIWNRDMFIYHSVMAGRSYVMSNQYRGTNSGRYIYEPFCKLNGADDSSTALVARAKEVRDPSGKVCPFVVIDATDDVEPVNFEALQLLRRELERVCPDGAVGSIAGGRMYALDISADDVDNYIRGNEEERKNYLEGNPAALIKGYDITPTTFRKWLITEDGDQLRFRYHRYIPEYTEDEAKKYGYVGFKELGGKPVFIALAVDPMHAGKPGINDTPIPEANPDYDLAELAIAPVFINHVYTNEFVGDVSTLGNGTFFGVVKGLNGKWGWYNIQSEANPDNKIGNFRGVFEIVPRPEARAVYATSFIYRRCAQPLKSLCPVENTKISPAASTTSALILSGSVGSDGAARDVKLDTDMALKAGDRAKVTTPAGGFTAFAFTGDVTEGVEYTLEFANGTWTLKGDGETIGTKSGTADDLSVAVTFDTSKTITGTRTAVEEAEYTAMVFAAPTTTVKSLQFIGEAQPSAGTNLYGATIETL